MATAKDEYLKAYDEGYQEAGWSTANSIKNNPHKPDTIKGALWIKGFNAGRAEVRRIEEQELLKREISFVRKRVQLLVDTNVKAVDINARQPQFEKAYPVPTVDLLELRRMVTEGSY